MAAAWRERGQEPPPEFMEEVEYTDPAPELSLVESHYLMLFYESASCRQIVNGQPLPIPFTAIDVTTRRLGFDGQEFMDALYILRQMDNHVLTHMTRETR